MSDRSKHAHYSHKQSHAARPHITVHDHDVLNGRGVNIAQHPGNERFRTLVNSRRDDKYCSEYTTGEKRALAKEIISHIKSLNPPGRFLKRFGRAHGNRGLEGPWEELSEKETIKKTCQALRDCNRGDRAGYAAQVPIPHDVQEETVKRSATGLTLKEHAAAVAAATSTVPRKAPLNAAEVASAPPFPTSASPPIPLQYASITASTPLEQHQPAVTPTSTESRVERPPKRRRSHEFPSMYYNSAMPSPGYLDAPHHPPHAHKHSHGAAPPMDRPFGRVPLPPPPGSARGPSMIAVASAPAALPSSASAQELAPKTLSVSHHNHGYEQDQQPRARHHHQQQHHGHNPPHPGYRHPYYHNPSHRHHPAPHRRHPYHPDQRQHHGHHPNHGPPHDHHRRRSLTPSSDPVPNNQLHSIASPVSSEPPKMARPASASTIPSAPHQHRSSLQPRHTAHIDHSPVVHTRVMHGAIASPPPSLLSTSPDTSPAVPIAHAPTSTMIATARRTSSSSSVSNLHQPIPQDVTVPLLSHRRSPTMDAAQGHSPFGYCPGDLQSQPENLNGSSNHQHQLRPQPPSSHPQDMDHIQHIDHAPDAQDHPQFHQTPAQLQDDLLVPPRLYFDQTLDDDNDHNPINVFGQTGVNNCGAGNENGNDVSSATFHASMLDHHNHDDQPIAYTSTDFPDHPAQQLMDGTDDVDLDNPMLALDVMEAAQTAAASLANSPPLTHEEEPIPSDTLDVHLDDLP